MKTPFSQEDYKTSQKHIKDVIRSLKDPNSELPTFLLKKTLHQCYGSIDDEHVVVGIFYDPVSTVIHECLHFLHSDWRESRVLKVERMIRRYINIKQVIIIIKLFAKSL